MPLWMIHLRDGRTLTDEHASPDEIEDELITGVDRLIEGKLLTVTKSGFAENLFVGTEEYQDVMLGGTHATQTGPTITKRILGGYIKGTNPPLQFRLTMDPRTLNTELRFIRVKKMTRKGINADPIILPKKGDILHSFQKTIAENVYTIIDSPDVERVMNTSQGIRCILKIPLVATLIIKNRNVLLLFEESET